MSTESALEEEEAGRQQPGSQDFPSSLKPGLALQQEPLLGSGS